MRGVIGNNVWGRGGSYGRATKSRFWEKDSEERPSEQSTKGLNERRYS